MWVVVSAVLSGCGGSDPDSTPSRPPSERVSVEPWAISLEVPQGSTVGPVHTVLGEVVDIDATAGCGADIQILRSAWSDRAVGDAFAAATRQDSDKHKYPLKEQGPEGYRVKHVIEAGLGSMRSAEIGTRIGDHFYQCVSNGGPTPIDDSQADCVFKACSTLRSAR